MQHLSAAFLIFALVIAARQDGVVSELVETYDKMDQVAQEAKNRAVTIIDGPKLVAPPPPAPPANTTPAHQSTEHRPPSKPPINPSPDKNGKPQYVELPRLYYGQIQNLPPLRQPYNKALKIQNPKSVFKYHKVIPLQPVRVGGFTQKQQPLVFAASTGKTTIISKPPKFSLPVQTINGIRTEFVRPPHLNHTSSTTTTTVASTTTTKYLRTKRIWPKRITEKKNVTVSTNETASNKTDDDLNTAASHHRIIIVDGNAPPSTRAPYRRVTRVPKKKPTTPEPANYSTFEPNDWVPIVPSHYTLNKVRKFPQTPINRRSDFQQTPINRRSDALLYNGNEPYEQKSDFNKRMLYLQSFGLIPMANSPNPSVIQKKNIYVVSKKRPLKSYSSGYRKKPVLGPVIREYDTSEPNVVTKIKHHHHHHHHKYVKTVEKPVRVEVPKPVPVPVPMPVPFKVEHKVPYPVPVRVPHPIPVKVIEKEYIPKPYPVIQHVPIYKPFEIKVPQPIPVPYEKRVPVPYQVKVPVDKIVHVTVEKKVPYPVPYKVFVPQPYPVETKVPYPVKEPVEVIKHVAVKVPYPQPYPVKVPVKVPYPVEKRVPYPVEIEKKVPVPYPFKIHVPEKVEVEKKIPIYIPRPYPVEKKVPVPFRVPYPVQVPIKVPVGIPILVHPTSSEDHVVTGDVTVDDGTNSLLSHYSYSVVGNSVNDHDNSVTQVPQHTVTYHGNIGPAVTDNSIHTVTVHGNTGLNGFQSRSDVIEYATTPNIVTTTQPVNSDPQAFTDIKSSGSQTETLTDVTTTALSH